MSYKAIFSGSAGPFSGILRLRVAGLMTLRFFCKTAFFAWLVARPFFCRLPCRATCGPAFILSASVSRGLWPGLYSVGFRVAWLVVRPFFLSASVSRDSWSGLFSCRLPCCVACGSGFMSLGFMSLGCCHRWCHRLRYRRPRRALYRRSRPMDLQSHSYPANRPEIATP